MPLLAATDALPSPSPQRVLVAGTSGSGKTTLGRRVAAVLGVRHVEIDALHHGPGWVKRPTFEADVERYALEPAWTTEWQYSQVRGLLAERADLVIWLDLPRATVMRQVIRRTLRRRLRRERLWNDNIEPPLWTFITDDEHIVRWAWRTHAQWAERVRMLLRSRPHLPVVRLTSHAEAAVWVARLAASIEAAASDSTADPTPDTTPDLSPGTTPGGVSAD